MMNTKGSPKLFAAGLLFALLTLSQGQVTKSRSGYTIRMKFIPGQVMRYQVDAVATQAGRTVKIQIPIVATVKSVSNGVGTIESKSGPVTMNGQVAMQVRTETLKRDARGNLVGSAAGATGMGSIGLPSGPVKIRGTWKNRTKTMAGSAGLIDVDANYRLIGLESLNGRQTAKINLSMIGVGNAKVTGNGTMWIAVADGSLVKSTTSMKITIGKQTMPMTVTTTRK